MTATPVSKTFTKNRAAFLDMLAKSEGTSTSKFTKNDGYDVVVGGLNSPNIFVDYSTHPNILVTVNEQGLKSTAAGRYQLLYRWYVAYKAQLKLPDFSPTSQDLIAIQQIIEQHALADIDAGRLSCAISKCANIWASLPGNSYNQAQRSLAWLTAAYKLAGGTVS